MDVHRSTREIRLIRSIIIQGHGACDAGDVFEVSRALAEELIGAGSAVSADGEQPKAALTRGDPYQEPPPRRLAPMLAGLRQSEEDDAVAALMQRKHL